MLRLIFISLIFLLSFTSTQAEEISAFDAVIKLDSKSNLQVSETITYDYGAFPKHGIYRYLPLSYTHQGDDYQLHFSRLQIPGHKFSRRSDNNKLSLQIGSAEQLLSGRQIYNISYLASGAVSDHQDYDRLHWQITGYGWPVVINNLQLNFDLPRAIPPDQIIATCQLGPPKATSSCDGLKLNLSDAGLVNGLSIRQDQISVGSGLSLSLQLAKGIIDEQGSTSKLWARLFKSIPFLLIILSAIL